MTKHRGTMQKRSVRTSWRRCPRLTGVVHPPILVVMFPMLTAGAICCCRLMPACG